MSNGDNIIKEISDRFNERRRNLALKMFNDIFFFGGIGFRLNLHNEVAYAPLSPYYFSFRNAVRIPEIRKELALILKPFIENICPKRLVDLPESITPLVATISDNTDIPIISIRSEYLKGEKKYHGIDTAINGEYKSGETVLIIDDVCSARAFTKLKAIEILKEAKLSVYWTVKVLLDREEGGKEILKAKGYALWSLFALEEIMQWYLEAKLITQEQYTETVGYSESIKAMYLWKGYRGK